MQNRAVMPSATPISGIRDNHRRGLVADFRRAKLKSGSRLSVVSAYFTIYAYETLKQHLDQIGHLNFVFGEPRFISSLDRKRRRKRRSSWTATACNWPITSNKNELFTSATMAACGSASPSQNRSLKSTGCFAVTKRPLTRIFAASSTRRLKRRRHVALQQTAPSRR